MKRKADIFFLIFAQNIDRGYTLGLPHCSDLDLFKSKVKLTFLKSVYGEMIHLFLLETFLR